MLVVLDGLKSEMDGYIERMRGLLAHFQKQEQDAIELPVDVNGAVLLDRGRREDRDAWSPTWTATLTGATRPTSATAWTPATPSSARRPATF
jgi:hypothetical protein